MFTVLEAHIALKCTDFLNHKPMINKVNVERKHVSASEPSETWQTLTSQTSAHMLVQT